MQETDLWAFIKGQTEAVNFLKKAAINPVHAYLFVGPEGAGREEIARAFSGSIFVNYEEGNNLERCKDLAWRGIHPDLSIIEPEGRTLRVSDAQKIIFESSRSPVESQKKVLVVNRFDTAEPEAVASLLKTIEEPSPTTIFILLSESIPDSHVTISSRCVRVDVPVMTVESLTELLKGEGIPLEEAALLSEASGGNLGRARLLQEDPSFIVRQEAWSTLPDRLDGSGAAVSTIEHLMAALYGKGIDNLLIEIDAEEVPILDGSSKNFVEAIDSAGFEISDQPIKIIIIDKEIVYKEGEKSISFKPSKISLEIDFEINFKNEIINTQKNNINIYMDDLSDMYNSRTFCLYEDIEKLKKMNLAKGGSLENAIVVKDNQILNDDGLRNDKEFVNHKILDCIGDLYLAGYKIVGKVVCSQGGHSLTNQLLREVFQKEDNFTIFEIKEKNIPHSLINRKYLRSIA